MILKLKYLILVVTALVGVTSVVVAKDKTKLATAEVLGKKYYVYTAKKGESLFGIARARGWDDAILAELNPDAVSPLKKGMIIYYPINEDEDNIEKSRNIKLNNSVDLVHKVKRGESVYSIAQMYGVSVEKIYSLNPSSKNGVNQGDNLLIKEATQQRKSDNSSGSIFYTAKKGDTLFSIAKHYGVSVEALMKMNPGINENSFRSDETIKVPKKGSGIITKRETVKKENLDSLEMRQVDKKETWSSIARTNGISEDDLRKANPNLNELKSNKYIVIPHIEVTNEEEVVVVIDPRESSDEGIADIYGDIHNNLYTDSYGKKMVNVAVVTENSTSNKDKEFLRGFLTGISLQKNKNFGINFKVIKGESGSEKIIETLDEFKPTVVFSIAESNLPSFLNEYSMVSGTPVVNTFDIKSTAYNQNPYIVQLMTPSMLFNDNVAQYIKERYGDRTLLLVGDKDENDLLAQSLTQLWDADKVKNTTLDMVVTEHFNPNGKYLIYCCSVKKGEVKDFVDAVAKVRQERVLADINSIGRPNLIVMEEDMIDSFKNAAISIPSRFYIDKNSAAYQNFIQSYKNLFDRQPVKSLPLYAAVGYDTSCYFIPQLADTKGDMNGISPSSGTVQSDFELWRTNNWSGFINSPVYVIDYTPFGIVNKNVISYGE